MKPSAYSLLLLLALLCSQPGLSSFMGERIECRTNGHHTPTRFLCDGDNDCGDNSDEDHSLCEKWRNFPRCGPGMVICGLSTGTPCLPYRTYCSHDPPCKGDVDRRLCVMLNSGRLQRLEDINLTTTKDTPPPTTTTPFTTAMPTTPVPPHVIQKELTDAFKEKLSNTLSHPDCPQLYTRVGDLCLSVFFLGNMTWLEGRAFCKAIGGDLFTMGSDFATFAAILQHFATTGVAVDFWLGGRYVNETEGWMWVDDTPLPMGSPCWAVRYDEVCRSRTIPYLEDRTTLANDGACYHYQQAPPEGTTRHCVAATYRHYWYLSDESCEERKSPLCVLPREKKQAL